MTDDFSNFKQITETVTIKGDMIKDPRFRLLDPGTWTKKRRAKRRDEMLEILSGRSTRAAIKTRMAHNYLEYECIGLKEFLDRQQNEGN